MDFVKELNSFVIILKYQLKSPIKVSKLIVLKNIKGLLRMNKKIVLV